MQTVLIFTDLDGTLLDHDDYSFAAAIPALERIRQLRIPLIINSSKTYAEIAAIREQLNNHDPFIVENGAVVFIPGGLFPDYTAPLQQVVLGRSIEQIIPIIDTIRSQYHFEFQGFSDFSATQVVEATGLSQQEAANAKKRLASEPIQWRDSDANLLKFKALIEAHGLQLIKGGRFFHIMGENDKSQAMKWLLARYQQFYEQNLITIALGDSHNDQKMLEQADFAGIIRKKDGSFLQLNKASQKIIKSNSIAPLGWLEVIEQLLRQISGENYG